MLVSALSGILPSRPPLKKRAHCLDITPSGVASFALFVWDWMPTTENPGSSTSLRFICGLPRTTEMLSAANRQIKSAKDGAVLGMCLMVGGLLRRVFAVVNVIEMLTR